MPKPLHVQWLTGLLTLVAPTAVAEPLTARNTIAAMPAGTESVILWRPAALSVPGSVVELATRDRPLDLKVEFGGRDDELGRLAELAASERGPTLVAVGGSFLRNEAHEVRGLSHRSIWNVTDSLAPFRERLQNAEGIAGLDREFDLVIDGVRVFRGTATPPEDRRGPQDDPPPPPELRFVAIVDDHTLVIAPNEQEVRTAVRRLLERATDLPEPWSRASEGLPLEAPVLILRRFEGDSEFSFLDFPRREQPTNAGLSALGLALTDPVHGEFSLRLVADQPREAARLLRSQAYLPPSDFAWQVELAADTLDAKLTLTDYGRENRAVLLRLLMVWGTFRYR